MILVDSSGWLAYFIEHAAAPKIETYLSRPHSLILPTIVMYEVYRQLIKKISEEDTLSFIAQMEECHVSSLGRDISFLAAEVSHQFKLGTADAIIYATALTHKAKLITLDNDFRGLPHCEVIDSKH